MIFVVFVCIWGDHQRTCEYLALRIRCLMIFELHDDDHTIPYSVIRIAFSKNIYND